MTWPIVELGTVADTALGKMLDRGRSRGLPSVPYLRNVNVQWDRIDTADLLEMELADDDRKRFEVEPGDLLVCEGGEIGRAAIWRGPERIAYQKALHRVRSRGDLDLTFLRYVLEHRRNDGTLVRLSTGSTIAHLPQQQLRRVPVPMPSLGEQRRIVEILEDHLSRLDAAEGLFNTGQARLASLTGSVLRSVLSSDVPVVALSDVLDVPLSNGRSVPTLEGGFPVLRLTALKDEGVDLSERKPGAWTAGEAAQFLVTRGDFLVARGNGSLRLVGRGSLVGEVVDPVAFPDTAIRVRPDRNRMLAEYLDVIWNSRLVRQQIEGVARTTAGIYKINQRHMEDVRIPLPDIRVQKEVTETVLAAKRGSRRLDDALQAICGRSAALRRALLAAAFEGKLTGRHTDQEVIEEVAAARG